MKTKIKIAVFYLLTVILSGCVSLNPLFTPPDLISDANLSGSWYDPNAQENWIFDSHGIDYECIFLDKQQKSGKFEVGLGKIGNNMFLDFYPKGSIPGENEFYQMHFLPVHSFSRINLEKDSLQIRFMNPEGLQKLIESDPNIIKYEKSQDDRIVLLTSSTKQLQEFILKYGIDDKYQLFMSGSQVRNLHRIKVNMSKDANEHIRKTSPK